MPFLQRTWYAAAYSNEVTTHHDGQLFHRKLLNQDVVFFRRADGKISALQDRCPHRFAPLHMGRVIGDTLQCGYHGLRFDCSGQCVENPHGQGFIPRNAVVRHFPTVERYGLVWIWMGPAGDADESILPDYSFLDDKTRSVVAGHHVVACHYELVNDNLADLTHIQFVHRGYQQADNFDQAKYEATQTGRSVTNSYFFENVKVSPLWGRYLGDPDLMVDRWAETTWHAPSLFTITASVARTGHTHQNKLGSIVAAHLLTPETESSTHYFYAHTRDYKVGDPQTDDLVREWQRVGFREQDQPFLEGAQERMLGQALMDLNPVLLATDAGAMRIRRQLQKMLAEEATTAPAQSARPASGDGQREPRNVTISLSKS